MYRNNLYICDALQTKQTSKFYTIMKRTLLTLLLVFVALTEAFSQSAESLSTLHGRILEAGTQNPVAYSTVAVYRDSTLLNATGTADDGTFRLEAVRHGRYTLSVTMVGYNTLRQEIKVSTPTMNLGDLHLTQGVEMENVVIKVQKPVVTATAEKLAYSVEDDPQAEGSTLQDIMRKVPQLSIDGDGNVQLNGKSDFKVLLNGHPSAAFNNNLKNIIQSMPASQISRIEVISNPSTRYDAEGTGGIINIITVKKKQQDFGFNGSLSQTVMLSSNPVNEYGSASFALQAGKFALSAEGWWGNGGYNMENASWKDRPSLTERYESMTSKMKSEWNNMGFNVNMSYQPDTLNLLTFELMYWNGGGNTDNHSLTVMEDDRHNPLRQFESPSWGKYRHQGSTFTLNYERNLGRTGHTLTLSEQYELSPTDNSSIEQYSGSYNYTKHQTTDTRYHANSFQADYTNPLSEHHSIEAGLKHIYRYNSSPMYSQIFDVNDAPLPDSPFSLMKYRQHILALYTGYGWQYTHWSGHLGARVERTWNNARAEDNDHTPYSFKNRQFDFIPYINLTYTPQPSHILTLSYTQRLQRPSINELSPAVTETPTEISYGNPHLEACNEHSFRFNYSHFANKWSINLSTNYSLSDNVSLFYKTLNDEGKTISTIDNRARFRGWSISGNLSLRPSEKFNLSYNVSCGYKRIEHTTAGIRNRQWLTTQSLNTDFALWNSCRFITTVVLFPSSMAGNMSLDSKSEHYTTSYTFTLQQKLLKKRFTLTLAADNLFSKRMVLKSMMVNPEYSGWTKTIMPDTRMFRIGLSYHFGKQGVGAKRTRRNIVNDDIKTSQPQQGGSPM